MSGLVRFGSYEVDLRAGHLRKHGVRIHLRDQSLQVLSVLLEHAGEVVTREELQRRLWHGEVFVDFENNLNTAVARLRGALCDPSDHPRFIETLPRRGYRFIGRVSEAPATPQSSSALRARLLVLPFVNLSGDPAQDYFSEAMTDETITALASLSPKQLAVIARTTAMHYKGTHKDVARIARELQVDYVVEGGIRRFSDQVLVNVQLIQTSDQAHLFARKYEAELRDIFRMHSFIAQDIAPHVGVTGVAEEVHDHLTSARRRRPTENLTAYNDYIQGRYLAERRIPEEMAKAKQHFEAAIAGDPEFALAHMALADLYTWLGYTGTMPPKDAFAIGFPYARRAVEIDDTLAEAHAVLAEYHKQLDYNWPAAEREMAKALELNPASSFVRYCHAVMILMPHNLIDEAVDELKCALELDPLAFFTCTWFGIMLLLAQEYDRAIDEARRLLELEPNSCWPPFITGIAYRQKYFEESVRGNVRPDFAEKAIAGHRRAVELAPGADHMFGWLGLCLGVCGHGAEARALLEQLRRSNRYMLPTSFGHIHLGLGEIDATFEWFDRAVEERDQMMMPIQSYAHFDPLRADPRFAVLLRKMKLEAWAGQASEIRRYAASLPRLA